MAGFGSKVRWNAGEGIEPGDFEQMDDFAKRQVVDEYLYNLAGRPQNIRNRTYRDELRPQGNALMPLCDNSTLNIAIHHGAVLAIVGGTQELDDTSLVPEMLFAYTGELSVAIAAGDATLWRRDLIQARIVSADEGLVSRDFEDGVTRAKSTQSLLKRTNLQVEVSVKAGGLVGSAPLADVIAAEPAPDAGWFRLASIRMDPTQAQCDQRTLWDWRMPMGCGSRTIMPSDFVAEDPACWNVKNFGFQQLVGQCEARGYLCSGDRQIGGDSDGSFFRYDQRRIAKLLVHYRFDDNASNLSQLGPQQVLDAHTFTNLQDVIARTGVGAFYATRQLYRAEDVGFGSGVEDPPWWANGWRNPAYSPSTGNSNQPIHSEATWHFRGGNGTGAGMDVRSAVSSWWGM